MPDVLKWLRRLAAQQAYSALYEYCCQHEAGEPKVQVLLALAAAQLGEGEQARALLAALNTAGLDRDGRIDLAAVHLALGELPQALELLEREQAQGTASHALLLARLGFCRQQQGCFEEAFTLFEQSLALSPQMPVYLNLLRLCVQQQWAEAAWPVLHQAELHWQQSRERWPADSLAFYEQQLRGLRLDLWLLTGALNEAESWLEAQQERLPEADWCALLTGYAQRLQQRDRHAEAEARLRAGLQQYAGNRSLLTQLAELARFQGRSAESVALLRRAIAAARQANEPTAALWLQLGRQAVQHNPALAAEAIKQASDELAGLLAEQLADEARQKLAFEVQLLQAELNAEEQQFDAAESSYRRLLAQRPGNLSALQGLGQLLMQLGRIDEAVDCFEQVKASDPARGHGALINARRFPEDDATLEKLEQVARTPSLEGSVRAGLLLKLASAQEKRKEYDKAFALADEANTASRRWLRYNSREHRQRCARIRHAFGRSLYELRQNIGNHSTLPVFVVGMPRSGTTLVEQMLAGHSQVHGAGELGLVPGVIAGLERWERRTGSGRTYPDCVDDLDAQVVAGITGNMLKELRAYAPDARHVVDKLPHNFENIGLIRLLFPNAKIISVRRDPRDIAISNYFTDFAAKHGGMGFAYDLGWIGEQLADHNLLMHHWQQVFSGDILEVQYEAVVANPEASARRMLDYLGLEWEPQVLNFNELERPVKTASVWQVRQPIYHSSREKWRRYEAHLAPLIVGTNKKIQWEPIEMVSLPEPGWLNQGVAYYRAGRLDEAERCFKQLLHFLPEHAAAGFMLGLVYCDKGHLADGIALMEQAQKRCPWNRQWRDDLARARRLHGAANPEYDYDGETV